MAFYFSGSLLRANFGIVSLFFLFDTVIVRGKEIFFLLSYIETKPLTIKQYQRHSGIIWLRLVHRVTSEIENESYLASSVQAMLMPF